MFGLSKLGIKRVNHFGDMNLRVTLIRMVVAWDWNFLRIFLNALWWNFNSVQQLFFGTLVKAATIAVKLIKPPNPLLVFIPKCNCIFSIQSVGAKHLTEYFLILSLPIFPFDPPKNNRKPLVFWCFQGDQKGTLGRRV